MTTKVELARIATALALKAADESVYPLDRERYLAASNNVSRALDELDRLEGEEETR